MKTWNNLLKRIFLSVKPSKHFLRGFGSVLNIFPGPPDIPLPPTRKSLKSYEKALKSDLEAIRKDFEKVIKDGKIK